MSIDNRFQNCFDVFREDFRLDWRVRFGERLTSRTQPLYCLRRVRVVAMVAITDPTGLDYRRCDVFTVITIGDCRGPRVSDCTPSQIVASAFCDARCLAVEVYRTSTGELVLRSYR